METATMPTTPSFFQRMGERTEPGGCNDHIAPAPHSPAGGPHGVAGTILHPHGGRPRDEASEARILVQMQSLPEVVRRCPPAGPDAQHEHAGLHAGREPPLDGRAPVGGNSSQLQGSLYRGICRPGPSQDCGRVPQDRGGGEAPDRAESQIPAEVATGEGETGRAKEGESQVSAEVAAGEGETGRVKEGESTRHGEEDQSSSRSYSEEGRGPGASSKESAGSFQAQRCLVGGESAPGACSGGWPSSSPSGLGSAHGDRRAGRVVGSLAPATGTNSARGGANNYAASEEATDSLGSQGASQGRSDCSATPWRKLSYEDGEPAVHGSDLLSRDPSCHSSSAAAGWTGESGQSHSGTTATASAFSKLQLAGTETIGSPSGTCSSSSEACASSAQADTGLAVQYPGATTSSAVLSERQPGSVNTDLGFLQPEEAAPVKSFSPSLSASRTPCCLPSL